MKFTFGPLARRVVRTAGAFAVVWSSYWGSPALAQGGDPDSDPGSAILMYLDDTYTDETSRTTGATAKKMERIVWAKCLRVEQRKVQPAYVKTYYEFEILRVVKGSFPNGRRPGARFGLAHMGGTVGNWSTETRPRYPRLGPGQEYVLLADGEGDEDTRISVTRSVYRVHTDSHGRKTVTPRPTGMTLYRAVNGQAYERMPGVVTVEDFLFSLRKLDGDDGGATE